MQRAIGCIGRVLGNQLPFRAEACEAAGCRIIGIGAQAISVFFTERGKSCFRLIGNNLRPRRRKPKLSADSVEESLQLCRRLLDIFQKAPAAAQVFLSADPVKKTAHIRRQIPRQVTQELRLTPPAEGKNLPLQLFLIDSVFKSRECFQVNDSSQGNIFMVRWIPRSRPSARTVRRRFRRHWTVRRCGRRRPASGQ